MSTCSLCINYRNGRRSQYRHRHRRRHCHRLSIFILIVHVGILQFALQLLPICLAFASNLQQQSSSRIIYSSASSICPFCSFSSHYRCYQFSHSYLLASKKPSMTSKEKKERRKIEDTSTGTSFSSANLDSCKVAVNAADGKPKETLPGGPALIFAMARRMLVWDDESYIGQNDTYRGEAAVDKSRAQRTDDKIDVSKTSTSVSTPYSRAESRPAVLPRWHPHGGISDVNPAFRQKPPAMNSAGYAASIRRNSRKRNKPSLWRHSLRTYNRMKNLEEEEETIGNSEMKSSNDNENGTSISSTTKRLVVRRKAAHHEGAIVACAKLGLWRDAFRIYDEAVSPLEAKKAGVTDNMILALIRAAVIGSKTSEMKSQSIDNKREPLDMARNIVVNMQVEHCIPLDPVYVNPLAAGYQNLGLFKEAEELIQTCLSDRLTRIERSDSALNVNDVQAKDRESYGLLVRGGVANGDWSTAVGALSKMTEAGMYPTDRQTTNWNEIAVKREKGGRKRRSWKKRRDQAWLHNL